MENYMKRKKSEDEKLSAKRKHPIDPDAMYMFVDIVLSLSCKPTKREREEDESLLNQVTHELMERKIDVTLAGKLKPRRIQEAVTLELFFLGQFACRWWSQQEMWTKLCVHRSFDV